MDRFRRLALASAIIVALPVAASAHHGWSWTEEQESRIVGTIVSIDFGNPHTSLKLRTAQGTWNVELAPPAASTRAGFIAGSARPGDRAILTGHRSRDPKQLAFKAETITVNGKTYDVYPGREKTVRPTGPAR